MLTQDERDVIEWAITALDDYLANTDAHLRAMAGDAVNGLKALLAKDTQPHPQPIATAPMDGTPLLTDEGVVRFWGGKWQDWRGAVSPEYWTPLPEWLRK